MGVLVRQRPGKTGWWVIASHQRTRSYKRFSDQSAAKKYARALEEDFATAAHQPAASALTLREYFTKWMHEHVETHRKPSTLDQYSAAWNKYIEPALGDRPLQSIARADLRALMAVMARDGKTRATIKAYLAPLSAMFNQAIADELVAKNPAFRLLPDVRGSGQSRVAQVLTSSQLAAVLEVCHKEFALFYPFILTLARTGMRVGEAVALRWQEVDFAAHTIVVRRTQRIAKWGRSAEEDEYSPKSGKWRAVPMSDDLERVLRAWHAARNKDEPRVFSSVRGGKIDLPNFRKRQWRRIVRHAAVPMVRMHDIRHTVATLLLEADVPLIKVKEILGHHSIKVTADLYGHLASGKYRDEVNVLDQVARGSQVARTGSQN